VVVVQRCCSGLRPPSLLLVCDPAEFPLATVGKLYKRIRGGQLATAGHSLAHQLASLGNSGAGASLPVSLPCPAVTQRPAAGRQHPAAVD